jgi:hypothetical protein
MRPGPKAIPASERFWRHVEKTETCWLWRGATMVGGYGRFGGVLVHRFALACCGYTVRCGARYTQTCGNRLCVNPQHITEIWTTAQSRFWKRVAVTDRCWLWTGGLTATGYGQFHFHGRPRVAHKYLYEFERGPVPDGLELDHLCRVRNCVRPDHLEAVTHAENIRRGEWRPYGEPARPRV